MAEFYAVPMHSVKTNESYIIPTKSQGSIFSHHNEDGTHKEHKTWKKFCNKFKTSHNDDKPQKSKA